ncbi:glycosyltransferase family 61 protein [Nocardioides kongjuensis]|uniref:Capsular polysaccharide biosynthesis protein n=2 Tax=Nocardioides kongjuensis TaxID=349522 RepID=A0A852RF31_9ACTN|nr:glycosyltransferase 61 family protein [Nocardioides kongjuensis]NYD32181.1 capsular polysaccharide biosynthesis protein [Nocardioides kongjuensis]
MRPGAPGRRFAWRRRRPSGRIPDDAVVGLVAAHLAGRADALVVVIGASGTADRLRAAGPHWRVLHADAPPAERLVDLALAGRAEVIVDLSDGEQRLRRFHADFFHLAAGGAYVVPGAAGELGPSPGPLGAFLAECWAGDAEPLRAGKRSLTESRRIAVRMHVTGRAEAGALVLTHDLPDVLVKLDEPQGNAYVDRLGGPHRVLSVLAAETPPDARVITEGPEQREPAMDRPVAEAAIALRDYRDVVVDVEQTVMTDLVVLPDTFRHNQWPRLVTRRIADVAPRFGVPMTPVPADLPRLEGTYLHLDNEFRGHFGHLMTEVVSRMWSWPAALEIDPDVRVLVGAARKRPELAAWEYDFYEACGIPRDRVVRIDGQVRVERLLSGTPMFSNPSYVHPRIVETWDRIGDTLAARAAERDRPERIFVARRVAKRACTNADEVEALFVDHGFEVVYPEDHPLGEQVALFRAARVVAGYAGSGMFTTAFVPHPQRLVLLGSTAYTPRNEVLIAAVRRHRIDSVVSRADRTDVQSSFRVDLEREGPFLRSVLASL